MVMMPLNMAEGPQEIGLFVPKSEKKKLIIIKALQALHDAPLLHLHQASVITLSKIKSKGR